MDTVTKILYRCHLAMLLLLVAAALPARAQVAPGYAGIDHVQLAVADADRALAFYTKLFGGEVWKNNQAERHYVLLGQSHIALEARAETRIDHIGFGIENFDAGSAGRWLEAQGITWQDAAADAGGANDGGLRIDDRNDISTQLGRHDSWEQLTATAASREARPDPGPPIFEAFAIDEIFLTVTNLEVDSLFYSRMLDQTGMLQAGSLWYQLGSARLRLTQAPVGQMPGVAYFAVHVAYTDMEAAADAVFAAGGIVETILPNGFSFWDPDGIRVVVRSGDLY